MLNNSRKILFLTRLFLCGALIFAGSEKSSTIFAQNSAVEARVTSVGGGATISGNGRTSAKLRRGATLAPGDEIDTTGDGRVVIDLTDGSQVVVLPVRVSSSAVFKRRVR